MDLYEEEGNMSNPSQKQRLEVTDEAVAQRAYDLWQKRGCPEGDGAEDWQVAFEQVQAEVSLPPRRRPLKRLFAKLCNRAAL